MQLEIFTFAEAATVKNGQLSLLNTFSTWFARQEPDLFNGALVIQVRFRAHEQGPHRLEVVIVDADGEERLQVAEIPFTVTFPHSRLETQSLTTVLHLQTMLMVGQHEIRALIDGVEVATTPLGVERAK